MLVLATGTAAGKPRLVRAGAEDATFWRDLVEPHASEVNQLIRNARQVMREPIEVEESDFEWAAEQRAQFFRDGYHLMRHARTLAPQNVEVLALLGEAADEIGKPREAIAALEAALAITGPDKANVAVTGRLGEIYLRLGKLDQAIRWLRQAQASHAEGAPIVHLAHALAARGDLAAAVDALVSGIPEHRHTFTPEGAIVAFALAVHHDRDERHGAAFDVLDQLVRALQQSYSVTIKNELLHLRLGAPDVHYYRGLLYESLGQYVEARAEWAHYAAIPDAPWRARALGHIHGIDAQRRARPGPRSPAMPGTLPPPIIRRKLPRGP